MSAADATVLCVEVRKGTYLDSVVLMRVQRGLSDREGVLQAGVLMATPANGEILRESGLWAEELTDARPDDLVLAVRGTTEVVAREALAAVDELLQGERSSEDTDEYRFRSLDAALRARPEARWVMVSVPGQWAAGVAEEALSADRNVFLYSDNVSVEDEIRLKEEAARRGRLVLGPDCGTARIGGVGLGFSNRVREGGIGVVAASGTGLQTILVEVHRQGSGISQAIGVGGRDLSPEVGGRATRAALRLLADDPATRVLVIVSKPPEPAVAARVLGEARCLGKPVVVCFQGMASSVGRLGRVRIAQGLTEAARLAVELEPAGQSSVPCDEDAAEARRWIRGLFSGGTLAQELLLALRAVCDPLWANVGVGGVRKLEDPRTSREHAIVDLGADELTVGRPHPMLDPTSRAERLRVELADPEVAAVVLDVVLGDGSHADPAASLVEVVEEARQGGGEIPAVLVWIVGTELDPQGLAAQTETLRRAGMSVYRGLEPLVVDLLDRIGGGEDADGATVDADAIAGPLDAINVGLEDFARSVEEQEGRIARVDWRPPAGGDDRLAGILARMKRRKTS